ncbi:MAG: riboflavin biosynthesis protein RibF [Fibrobacterota bacterium]
MRILRSLRGCRGRVGTVVTLGNFDGVHRGHRRILSQVVRRAHALGARSVVVTFDPHTRQVVGKERGFHCLSTPSEKVRLLSGVGIDTAVFLRFGATLQRMGAAAFLEKVLLLGLRPREIVFGLDHRFGSGRTGDFSLLAGQCRKLGVRVSRVRPCRLQGAPVSSTRIRERMAKGDLAAAVRLLGGPYLVCGKVVKGFALGRRLGFPTANLQVPPEKLLMPDGVYAGHAVLGARRYRALVSLGNRPTFKGTQRVLEAHLLGYEGTLYGKELCLEIRAFVRPQKRLAGPVALAAHIRKDIDAIKRIIKN